MSPPLRGPGWGKAKRRLKRLPFLPPVLFWMLVVEVAVRLAPVARVSRLMGVPLDSTNARSPVRAEPDPDGPSDRLTRWQAGQLGTLGVVAPRWPFADGPCLRQALVTGHILRRAHPVLRLGVAPSADAFLAHAWVEVAGGTIGSSPEYLPLIDDRSAARNASAAPREQ
ncbi:MAG TPA: lasso peptide biosynthesis B2 protein [Acidimicrobiales bacterium]|nr:lasso peptide biosynthesis B2 protein [Acidimicrobiales bacterium]